MTCHEVRLYFYDPLRMDSEVGVAAEHLARCGDCARFVAARRELGAGLRLVRESAPEPSSALEEEVLASYRRYAAEDRSAVRSGAKRRGITVVWWSAGASALAVAAAVFVFVFYPAGFHPARATHALIVQKSTAQLPSVAAVTPIKATRNLRRSKTVGSHLARPARQAAAEIPAPEDFRSLFYCDPLSCGGALQLIRVQLPSSAGAFQPASAGGAIYADVLVGSDGIARGIRVVE